MMGEPAAEKKGTEDNRLSEGWQMTNNNQEPSLGVGVRQRKNFVSKYISVYDSEYSTVLCTYLSGPFVRIGEKLQHLNNGYTYNNTCCGAWAGGTYILKKLWLCT